MVEDPRPLVVCCGPVDEGSPQLQGVLPERKDVVAEDDDLVPAVLLVVFDQELACHKFDGVLLSAHDYNVKGN